MDYYKEIEDKILNAKSLKESLKVLEMLLSKGFSVWTDGSLYEIKQLVGSVNGLKIEIFSREHPPPHFHISGGGIRATFTITECEHLEGEIGSRERALVEWWYKRSRPLLIDTWNNTRPSDCQVGPIVE